MEKLCRVKVRQGMITDCYPLSNIEGRVETSTLATEDSTSYPNPSPRGLTLKLDGRMERFIFPNAGFRVNAGERVIVYADSLSDDREREFRTAQGLQVLSEGRKVLFQYKDDGNLEFMKRIG